MGSKELGADVVVAWPKAEIAVMGAESAAKILFRKDPPEEQKKKTEEYIRIFSTPDQAASRGYVDQVIEPASTRYVLLRAFEMLAGKKSGTSHGNLPL